ncbi:methyltransferase [Cryobacterium sp. 10I5]|uniref:DUF7059 domain-containing protein n=1 Tax=Cryobacterium sp. 10I5 TaxID=3048581 RepID=UPI002B23E199|nr:methyltransferase [Cryobacterium sp. 10I5]MEB0267267.1 methyltransferase [Cryobacterium sp. 10I5]
MIPAPNPAALPAQSLVLIPLLRADLEAAHYSVATLSGLWGPEADAALRRNQRVPALRALAALRGRLGRDEPSATLAQLFVLGLPVTRGALSAALPSLGAAGAVTLGLVARVGDDDERGDDAAAEVFPDDAPTVENTLLRPLVELRPYSFVDAHGAGSWWITSDLGELVLGHALGESHVLGVGGASLTLSGLLLPNQVDTALDLGTGCGIQALHASRHARHVVATDISVRALELAALNAALNGVTNIEFRLGSLFEPVAGERFDHIISNPPFVITPRAEGVPSYEYRDGGLVGDALVESVVRGATGHLTPTGVAQLLGNWEYRAGQDAFDRLAGWLEPAPAPVDPNQFDGDFAEKTPGKPFSAPVAGTSPSNSSGAAPALDAWIIEREVQSPELYAETWIRDGGTRPGTADFDRLYDAWLDDFAARGVTQVGFGFLLLRRPDADRPASIPRLRRLERLHGGLGHNPDGIGSHLAACLAAHDWHAAFPDDDLVYATLTVASDVTEERHFWPGQEDPTLLTLDQGSGFGRSVSLDTALAALIGACDGELAVGAIAGALAELLEVSERDLTAELLPRVRELLDDGFLLPPELRA